MSYRELLLKSRHKKEKETVRLSYREVKPVEPVVQPETSSEPETVEATPAADTAASETETTTSAIIYY